jgi:O-succinylbenzoate synthase
MNVALYRQNVVLKRPVRASAQEHLQRSRLFLRLDHNGHFGYGEVAPQPFTLNGDPGFDEVLRAVQVSLARLDGVAKREASLPSWSRVARLGAATPPSNVASALIEMALLDLELRTAGISISDVWFERFSTPRQATFSLLDDETGWLVNDDVERVRVKSAPGPLSARALERLSQLSVPVLLDYNCSANSDDDVLDQVRQIRDVASIAAVEQPFDVGNLIDHARLAARLDVPLSIDEGVRSLRDLTQITNYEAATMICVKPARVGGLANARTIIEKAGQRGLTAYLGGFFESPYARHVHESFANSCVSEPSDLGPVGLASTFPPEVESVAFGFGVQPSRDMLERAQRLSFV